MFDLQRENIDTYEALYEVLNRIRLEFSDKYTRRAVQFTEDVTRFVHSRRPSPDSLMYKAVGSTPAECEKDASMAHNRHMFGLTVRFSFVRGNLALAWGILNIDAAVDAGPGWRETADPLSISLPYAFVHLCALHDPQDDADPGDLAGVGLVMQPQGSLVYDHDLPVSDESPPPKFLMDLFPERACRSDELVTELTRMWIAFVSQSDPNA